MGQKFAAYDASHSVYTFYDSVDSPPPAGVDTIEITEEQWQTLSAGASSGKRIALDANKQPVLLDPLPPSREQVAAQMRGARDAALAATDWLVTRHQEEKAIGDGTTLTAAEFTALLKYRQTLRDIGSADGWPYVALPAVPDFLTASA